MIKAAVLPMLYTAEIHVCRISSCTVWKLVTLQLSAEESFLVRTCVLSVGKKSE